MTIGTATAEDLPALEQLWRDFLAEVPPAEHVSVDEASELREIAELVRDGIALVARDADGVPVGFALARRAGLRAGELTDLYVAPGARRAGVATALVREAVGRLQAAGVGHVELDVQASNAVARAVYARWGFREHRHVLVAPLAELAGRLGPDTSGPELGVAYVQTDDRNAVERAASAFALRIGSTGVEVDQPVDGWIAVRAERAARDPMTLRRLARELSDRLGAVVVALGVEAGAVVRLVALERGSVLDEYLSVPEFHGPLAPGDVVALAANPTVLHRLTGAEPAAIRAIARTATSPADLPPAPEHAAALAAVLGLPPLER